jgi:acetyltransferase-like isoleucine patch superfamily enzyme
VKEVAYRWDQEARRLVYELRHNPRVAAKKLARLAGILRAQAQFRGSVLGHGVATLGRVVVERPEGMSFGSRVTFLGGMVPSRLSCGPNGYLVIGDDVVINYGASLEAQRALRIGSRSMLASFVLLADRKAEKAGPITIGSDVWIAHGAVVEPGVTIGDGSVVSAGSVVTRDIPPNMLAMGSPARAMSLDLLG